MQHLLTLLLAGQIGGALPADSIETLRNRARDAEARFERLSRQLAPLSWSSAWGSNCDERIGRFCLRFDSTSTPPAASEPGKAVDARREAVEAMRRYFSAAPADRRAAGPLVRLLIRDGRAQEAVSSAAAYAALSGDTLWGDLLRGFASHWAGADTVAERFFIAAVQRMPPDERRNWLDLTWLLEPDERSRVRRLSADARADYERRFWIVADPLWITPANERWIEHVSRRVETRLLADVPLVVGMVRWGADLDELTIRYGTPSTRARLGGTLQGSAGMVEYWDTAQRAYDQGRMSRGLPDPPAPGERPVLYAATARTSYALQTVERMLELTHQATRFIRTGSAHLRVDAAAPISGRRRPRAALFAYDSAFTRRTDARGTATIEGDTARFALVLALPPGPIIYSAEILGDSAQAARARYALDTVVPASGLLVSDPLITRPFAPGAMPDGFTDHQLRPLTSLVVKPGDTLGIYAEIYRLRNASEVKIEVSLERAGGPSLIGRLARWMGVVGDRTDPSVAWTERADSTHAIALNLPLDPARTGMRDLVLRVTNPATGQRAEARRRILVRR